MTEDVLPGDSYHSCLSDENTLGLLGRLPEILWRGLLPARTLQVRGHAGHMLRRQEL